MPRKAPRARARAESRQSRATTAIAPALIDAADALGLRDLDESSLAAHLEWAEANKPDYGEFLLRVFRDAAGKKRQRCIQRRIDDSGLKDHKTLEAFDWKFQPKLDRRAIEELATLRFVERCEDLVFTGQTGTGKSHLLKALAMRACRAEYHVRYVRGVQLIEHLYAGLADNTYQHRLARWTRVRFLLIDDVGLGQLRRTGDEPTAAHMLFDLIDRRHLNASTALTSNLKLSAWGNYLGDATVTAAILDRLAQSAIFIDIDGPSYRQHLARTRTASARDSHQKPNKTRKKSS